MCRVWIPLFLSWEIVCITEQHHAPILYSCMFCWVFHSYGREAAENVFDFEKTRDFFLKNRHTIFCLKNMCYFPPTTGCSGGKQPSACDFPHWNYEEYTYSFLAAWISWGLLLWWWCWEGGGACLTSDDGLIISHHRPVVPPQWISRVTAVPINQYFLFSMLDAAITPWLCMARISFWSRGHTMRILQSAKDTWIKRVSVGLAHKWSGVILYFVAVHWDIMKKKVRWMCAPSVTGEKKKCAFSNDLLRPATCTSLSHSHPGTSEPFPKHI